jgi:MFS family permease
MPDTHDPYSALRQPSYRRLLAGNILASIASQMKTLAVGWEVYSRTKNPTLLGLMGLVQFIPVVLLSLLAGHVADRYSRKGLLLGAQGLMGSGYCALAAVSHFQWPIVLMFGCLLLIGIGQAFNMPARWALLPQLVPDEALPTAVTWNASAFQIASMVGPFLGGLVIDLTGSAETGSAKWAYLLASLCSLAVIILVAGLQPRPMARPVHAISFRSLLAGIQFVFRTKLILATITLDLFAVLLGGATALLPIFAKDILHVGPTGLGWLGTAPSIGAVVMALTLAHRPPLRRAGRTLIWAVAGFGVATIVFGLSEYFVLSFAMLMITGALDNISMVVRGTLVQGLTPNVMRGRVSAVNAIFIGSSNELGAFESGVTADWFGPVWSVVGGGIGTLVVVGVVMVVWPEVARLGSLHELKPQPA